MENLGEIKNRPVADRAAVIAAVITIQTVASLAMWFNPLVVGAVSDHLGFSTVQVAWLASADVSGVMIATLAALGWVRRASWRKVIGPALLILVACNLMSALASEFSVLYPLRIIAGLAAGSLMAIGGSVLGASSQSERNIALFTGVQLSCVAVCLLVLPRWIPSMGIAPVYFLLAALVMLCLPLILRMPANWGITRREGLNGKAIPVKPRVILLLTVTLPGFLFHTGVSSVWSYAERIGNESGLTASQIGEALAVAMYAGVLGSFIAYLAGMKFGRLAPFSLVLILQMAALYLLLDDNLLVFGFVLAMGMLGFGFNLIVGYQFGQASRLDNSGLAPVAYLLMLQTGMVFGPLLGAFWVTVDNHQPALWLAGCFFLASFLVSVGLVTFFEKRPNTT